MKYIKRIISDPNILLGKPIIKGTRISVELIIRRLSEGMEIKDLLEAYPQLKYEDILAALSYSAEILSGEEMIET
jgi:uncharacterized protein (DUF433 family)